MKARRHARILELVSERVVETQQELADLLRAEGMEVTQATVSRDIKELQLVKIPVGGGRYRYAAPAPGSATPARERMARLMREVVLDLDASEHTIVVKTLSGTASAAGEAIDHMTWEEVIGTVAGDNTLLLIIKPKSAVDEVLQRLRAAMGR
ncbi:MAG TPA: arginine repressor [Bacillota bacterium]